MARCDPQPSEAEFVYKTRSEQRLEWLTTRSRPLSEEESDELYRCLHAIYQRDWMRHHGLLTAPDAPCKAEDKQENDALLEKVLQEAVQGEWR